MPHYLLSLHSVEGEPREPMTDEQMQELGKRIGALEAEMKSADALAFSGRLEGAESAAVVHKSGDEVMTTDGPFAETKEQLAGFYIIEAEDRDAALSWASKTSDCVNRPIEVRPFFDQRQA